ncbi:glutamate synthase subunit beta [Leucobacter luti]|uniref:Glutamate synthase (NADH) small subunit n=1 Tax=Leucobacter luti TaxID=340320 RepID=A0A4Q7TK88_9MICO|nr:glutamate synthase subunit beta [Leucobacter luti]MBL3700242.1 glutamate synthase subunit beta [Leucobacter luti]RZT61034.1 glutamate synthase (NADH) small subunit [Leucobacter luti]
MADTHGFLTVRERELATKRPVALRLQDWREVVDPANPTVVARQASRCMDCGVAFCHQGCPLGNLIPEWNDLVYRERGREAADRLHETNNFPEFTGRACPAPCESACVLSINQPAVTIKQIENSIIDEAFARGWVEPQPPARLSGKTVAVVGSGPAGLAAAQQLTRAGHTVAVYERDETPGGLLRFGIPDFKLEKALVERRIEQLKAEGTRFRCGIEIGRDMSWGELRRRFDAVVVATGATVPRELALPGRELDGVLHAMDYLTAANRVQSGALTETPFDAAGKHVIVIGGGDTGADCVGTAHRQGARSVTNLAIGKQPGETRSDAQPWPVHPTLFELTSSHEEGGERRFRAATVEFVAGEAAGPSGAPAIAALRVAETGFTEAGRAPIPGTEELIDADLVLIAMGFTGPEPIVDPGLTLERDARGSFDRAADFSSALPGVFVAGDAGRGQSLIVWAIAEGRAAAAAVDRYLTGDTVLPSPVTAKDRAFT